MYYIYREYVIDNLLVRIHFIIEMIWWTGLAPWEFEFLVSGSLISTFLVCMRHHLFESHCVYETTSHARFLG